MELHTTSELASPTEIIPDTKYVKGEMRYMKIQNPGSVCGDAKTLFSSINTLHTFFRGKGSAHPQKIKHSENIRFATFPAVSAVSIPATTKSVNVPANIRKLQMKRNINAPRDAISLVGSALRYKPIG